MATMRSYISEYVDQYNWTERKAEATVSALRAPSVDPDSTAQPPPPQDQDQEATEPSAPDDTGNFESTLHPSVYRESVIHKDERGHYIDPFRGLASKPSGRRLMYDTSHPEGMYASQWSSELADHHGCYSFHTPTGQEYEQPWTQDLSWRRDGEQGSWPTDQWKEWTQIGMAPAYDGHSNDPKYSEYKMRAEQKSKV